MIDEEEKIKWQKRKILRQKTETLRQTRYVNQLFNILVYSESDIVINFRDRDRDRDAGKRP